jgi:hypothetical protein
MRKEIPIRSVMVAIDGRLGIAVATSWLRHVETLAPGRTDHAEGGEE